MSESGKSKIFTEKHITNLSIAQKNRFENPENHPMYGIKKEENPNFGSKRTEKTKQSMGKENHWNWQDGKSFEKYGIEFSKELKQSIKERDNYKCQHPGCTEMHNSLHVHHIDYDKQNNNSENLITLGTSCHTKTNGKNNRQYWTQLYQNIMMGKLMECLL